MVTSPDQKQQEHSDFTGFLVSYFAYLHLPGLLAEKDLGDLHGIINVRDHLGMEILGEIDVPKSLEEKEGCRCLKKRNLDALLIYHLTSMLGPPVE